VTSIRRRAFLNCTSLTRVTIPDSVTSIGNDAFSGCTSLTSVTIPNSVTSIGHYAFSECTSLTSVTIPNSVTSIGNGTFSGCGSLTSVTIPDSVTSIGDYAFSGCTSLEKIDVDVLNSAYASIGGVLFDKNQSTLLAFPAGKAGAYSIPNSVTSLREGAFSGCRSLTSVTIPDSVTSIEYGAFAGCTSLTRVYFEGNAPGIPDGGFPVVVFNNSPAVIVYFRAGTSGWSVTWEGRPTALWRPTPSFGDWLLSTGLLTQYPMASSEEDDPDQDGMSNEAEMLAATNPTDSLSVLVLESVPRPNDLSEEDRAPLAERQHALYIRSAPDKSYGVQSKDTIEAPWRTDAVVTASTTQKRLVFGKPMGQAFYRVILAQ
jgi:BspA type Leucine rich repeat region (6 copies)